MSESAIRNYELGNRYPDEMTLMNIADALEIDRAVLRDPNPKDASSVEQFLFELERLYGLVPKMIDGELHLIFDKTPDSFSDQEIINRYILKDQLYIWCSVRDQMLEGEISPNEYYAWQIAHSDNIGADIPIGGYYKLPLEQEIEMETARRAIGKSPVPVYDDNHVNVMPIPRKSKKEDTSATEEQVQAESVKPKRKPKNK